MEQRKTGRIILLSAFILFICLSRGIWFFAEKYLDSENYENRQMAEHPTLTAENYETFPDEYTSYFNDHLPFRNQLISLNSAIDYYCFKRSSSSYVVIGKNDYLFYSRTDDGNAIAGYQGTNLYSKKKLKSIAKRCIAMRDTLAEQGREFVLLILPIMCIDSLYFSKYNSFSCLFMITPPSGSPERLLPSLRPAYCRQARSCRSIQHVFSLRSR